MTQTAPHDTNDTRDMNDMNDIENMSCSVSNGSNDRLSASGSPYG